MPTHQVPRRCDSVVEVQIPTRGSHGCGAAARGRKNIGAARKSVACFQNTGHKTLAIPLKNQQTREINAARACLVACGVPDLTALPPVREVLSLTETPSLKQRAAAAIGGGTNFKRRGGCTPWYNRCALTNTGDGFSALLEARSTQSQIPISSRWLRAPTIAQSPCCQPVLCNSVIWAQL